MTEILIAEPDAAAGPAPHTAADAAAPCGKCGPNTMEYADLLGHDRNGHAAHNLLAKSGFVRTSEIALATDPELRQARNMGAVVLARIRERIPYGATPLDRYTPTVLMHRLPQGLALEPWMLVEPDKASTLWCLSAFTTDDERVWPHVHPRSISFLDLMPQTWRRDERVLLHAARSLYSSRRIGVDLAEAAVLLTASQWPVLLEAMRIRRDSSRSDS